VSAIRIVIEQLKLVAPVVSAIGSERKIYPIAAPEDGALPYLVVNRISERDFGCLGGAGRYYESRVQIDINGATASAVDSIGTAVKLGLDSIVKATIAGAIDVDIWPADTDYTDVSDIRSTYRRVMDFYVNWRSAS
jgi:hypothetical protein